MRASFLLAVVGLFILSGATAPAQIDPAVPAPYSYQGYWQPNFEPKGWNHPMSRIVFRNRTAVPMDVFYVDRFGSWRWTARLNSQDSRAMMSPVGDLWVVRDPWGRNVEKVRAGVNSQVVEIGGQGQYPGGEGRSVDLAFRNKADRPVDLYCVDRWGSWVWTGRIPEDGEMRLRSFKGQWWKATGPKGRVLMNYQAGHRDDTIVIR